MRIAFTILLFLNCLGTCVRAQSNFREVALEKGFVNNLGHNYALAVIDYDGDGLEDIFASRNVGMNRLFRQLPDGSFVETTEEAGLAETADRNTYNAVFGDLDNDGDPDLYLGNRLANDQLFRNDGGVFTEITEAAGINNPGAPRSVNFSDVDGDGNLDVYVVNFGADNHLYLNQANLKYTEVAVERGATDAENTLGMAAIFFDFDGDKDDDLYLVHDGNQANLMLRNDGNGYFTDASVSSNTNYRSNGMGVVAGDLTGDGLPDLYVTNLGANVLLKNDGDGTFSDVSVNTELADIGMGWGASLLDFDNDGLLDIYAVNNSFFSPFPNLLYRQTSPGLFTDVADLLQEGSPLGGLSSIAPDLDADGRQDLLVGNSGGAGSLQYFNNQTDNGHHWLRVKLESTSGNRDATGARLHLYTEDQRQLRIVMAGSGYAGQESYWQHFGLGTATQIDSLVIEWPNGSPETYFPASIDRSIEIREGGGIVSQRNTSPEQSLTVYPNPVVNKIKVAGLNDSAEYQIIDMSGRICQNGTTDQNGQIEVDNLTSGSYQLLLSLVSGSIYRAQFIKK